MSKNVKHWALTIGAAIVIGCGCGICDGTEALDVVGGDCFICAMMGYLVTEIKHFLLGINDVQGN
jgi:urease alpha subunit